MFQTYFMTDPILYISMLLGLGGVYVLISSFHDDDDGDDDGEKYIFNLEHTNLVLSLIHISEPTRQAEISYAVFCLKKKNNFFDNKIFHLNN